MEPLDCCFQSGLVADPEYGERFTTAAGLSMDKVMELSKLDYNGLIQTTLSSVM
ncbi:hypothetical protein [Lacrimispora brassicae]